ncbi:MAG: glutaminyl-peptide cyclotransferase [Pyrinomonadaceae bacterium]|nr:glutaminyl-peptide cyclotransferase [Sphingobacteriaceae bacterium]
MNKILSLLIISIMALSCKRSDKKSLDFASPVSGLSVASGKNVFLKTDAEPGSFDSIRYYLDEKFAGSRKDTSGISVSTSGLPLGARLLTARIFSGGDSTELTTNIQLLAGQAPILYSYEIVNTYPHDTTSFIEGLEFHEGVLYESDGGTGELGISSLRKVDLKTGKILKKVDIEKYFAEGLTVVGNKIIQLTYKEKVGFVYDKNTLNKISEFPYESVTGEGWGLAFNGTHILNTDGSNNIHLLNKDTYQKLSSIAVYDNNGPINQLNELEYIDGKIYANVWQKDEIVIIDPTSGAVEAKINLAGILPEKDRVMSTTDVLNGIAWDVKGKRLFVTGKKWNKLFEIKIKKE